MDRIAVERRSENMRRIRSKHTSPELAVRKVVRQLGYRYRLHGRGLPGRPDLVFSGQRKVLFVHGCFWHQHKNCVDGRKPKSNSAYWGPKLDRNIKRDVRNKRQLALNGWRYLTVWECQVEGSAEKLAARLRKFLRRS